MGTVYSRSAAEMLLSPGWCVITTTLTCSGNKPPSFENAPLFLRISYRCKLRCDHIYPHLPLPTLPSEHVFFLNDLLTLANVAHICMGTGPSDGAWES